jgi:amino acid transporter
MARPYRAGYSTIICWIALVLSCGFIALYMPGMPSALAWPYEWIIILSWWIIGFLFMLRMRNPESTKQSEQYLQDLVQEETTHKHHI